MKIDNIYTRYSILGVALAWLLAACVKEPAIESDASFIVENADFYLAGQAIQFEIIGEADYFTFYPGTATSSYDSFPGHKGISITANKFNYTYAQQGEYKATLVATSFGNWAAEEVTDVKSLDIVVKDLRNEFSRFYFKMPVAEGIISENTISFNLSDANNMTNAVPFWNLTSNDAKVYVNNVEQVNGITAQDFTKPKLYKIVSPSGEEKNYTVQVSFYPASNEKQLFTIQTESPDRVGIIDESTKTVNFTMPFGTRLTSIKLKATCSAGAVMKIGPRSVVEKPFAHNISPQPTTLRVTAENKTTVDYMIYTLLENAFKTFTFSNLNPEPIATIDYDSKTINVTVAPETDLTRLIASYTGNEAASTTVEGVEHLSGVTENDYTNPVEFVVTGQDGEAVTFTVIVTKF